jgi:hypothetical protein
LPSGRVRDVAAAERTRTHERARARPAAAETRQGGETRQGAALEGEREAQMARMSGPSGSISHDVGF